MIKRELVLKNYTQAQTEQVARTLAPKLRPGMFLAFYGDLGAGKTTFIRTLAETLGISDAASPTFTIVREHMSKDGMPFLHFDAYRLSGTDELYAIGFEDYLAQNGVIVMEWSENVPEALPNERLEVAICGSADQPRTIRLTALGESYTDLLRELEP